MTGEEARVLADQVDALAGQVARLELQMGTLIEMLSKRDVQQRCGIDSFDLTNLKHPLRAMLAKDKHCEDRRRRVAAAEREGAITRLIEEPKRRKAFEDLTGEKLADDYDFETQKIPRGKT
jgi:hypothetical protein